MVVYFLLQSCTWIISLDLGYHISKLVTVVVVIGVKTAGVVSLTDQALVLFLKVTASIANSLIINLVT